MNNDICIKLLNLTKDINEILEVLVNVTFDRNKAENIIVKHNSTNEKVNLINSPLNPGFVRFEESTEDMIKNNLLVILEILKAEYAEEMAKL